MSKRAIVILIAALVVTLGLVGAGWYALTTAYTFYTDAKTIREPAIRTTPRDILWQPPVKVANQWINSEAAEYEPRISWDGLTLFIVRGKPGENADIYVCDRSATGWNECNALTAINSESDELGPEPSADGDALYFYSNRPGGEGNYDLWVSRRLTDGWSTPDNLGSQINTSSNEYSPALSPDGKNLYFSSNRPRPNDPEHRANDPWRATVRENFEHRDHDLYVADISDNSVRTVTALTELNSSFNEGSPAVSPVGDFLYFASDRPSGAGGFDIYRARRMGGRHLAASLLGSLINTQFNELDPALTSLGYELYFSSDRYARATGSQSQPDYDIYHTTSREVFREREPLPQLNIGWAGLWSLIGKRLLYVLAAILALLLLLRLLGDLRRRKMSLLTKCLVLSLFLHLLMLFLTSYWGVKPGDALSLLRGKGGGKRQVALSGAVGQSGHHQIYQQVRGELTTIELSAQRITVALPTKPELPRATPMSTVTLPAEPTQVQPQPALAMAMPRDARLELLVGSWTSSAAGVAAEPVGSTGFALPQAAVPKAVSEADRQAPVSGPRSAGTEIRFSPTTMPLDARAPQPLEVGAQRLDRIPNVDANWIGTSALASLDAPASPLTSTMYFSDAPSIASPEAPLAMPSGGGAAIATEESSKIWQPPSPGNLNARPVIAIGASTTRPTFVSMDIPPLESKRGFGGSLIQAPSSSDSNLALPATSAAFTSLPTQANELAAIPSPALGLPSGIHRASGEGNPESESSFSLRPGNSAIASAPRAELPLNFGSAPSGLHHLDPGRITETRIGTSASPGIFGVPRVPDAPSAAYATFVPTHETAIDALSSSFALPRAPAKENPYAQRAPEQRPALLDRMGGSEETEQAVARALEWLARHQSRDGHWDNDGFDADCGRCGGQTNFDVDVALTGLSLLCFLGADHTHAKDGPYRAAVQRGLDWLINRQRADGDLRSGETMYSHGIAAIALGEAYGMTRDDKLFDPLRRAVRFIDQAANRKAGGWRYDPGQPGDTSVLGWQVMALESAKRGGLEVSDAAFEVARSWLDRVSSSSRPGLYAYQPGRAATPSMTAEGMFVRELLGHPRDDAMKDAVAYLLEHPPSWKEATNTYYWYYATLALFQYQGDSWEQWNRAMSPQLISHQRIKGAPAGSWDPIGEWADVGGRIYQTALCTLMLEVYYRYLPLYSLEEPP